MAGALVCPTSFRSRSFVVNPNQCLLLLTLLKLLKALNLKSLALLKSKLKCPKALKSKHSSMLLRGLRSRGCRVG